MGFDTWAGVRRGWTSGNFSGSMDDVVTSPLVEEQLDEWVYADGKSFDHTTQYR